MSPIDDEGRNNVLDDRTHSEKGGNCTCAMRYQIQHVSGRLLFASLFFLFFSFFLRGDVTFFSSANTSLLRQRIYGVRTHYRYLPRLLTLIHIRTYTQTDNDWERKKRTRSRNFSFARSSVRGLLPFELTVSSVRRKKCFLLSFSRAAARM